MDVEITKACKRIMSSSKQHQENPQIPEPLIKTQVNDFNSIMMGYNEP